MGSDSDSCLPEPQFLVKNMQVYIYDDLSNQFINMGVEPYFNRF